MPPAHPRKPTCLPYGAPGAPRPKVNKPFAATVKNRCSVVYLGWNLVNNSFCQRCARRVPAARPRHGLPPQPPPPLLLPPLPAATTAAATAAPPCARYWSCCWVTRDEERLPARAAATCPPLPHVHRALLRCGACPPRPSVKLPETARPRHTPTRVPPADRHAPDTPCLPT